MSANEHTSPEVASEAARIVQMDDAELHSFALQYPGRLRSVAASALTQAADKPPQAEYVLQDKIEVIRRVADSYRLKVVEQQALHMAADFIAAQPNRITVDITIGSKGGTTFMVGRPLFVPTEADTVRLVEKANERARAAEAATERH